MPQFSNCPRQRFFRIRTFLPERLGSNSYNVHLRKNLATYRERTLLSKTMNDTIGILGLGLIGSAIATRLNAANYKVIGFDPHACCGRRETDRTLPASAWLRSWHPPNVFYWHWLRISTPIEDLCCWLRAGLASRRRDDHRFQVFDWMNIVWRLIDLRWTKTVLA